MKISEFLLRLRDPKPDRGGHMAFCPAHADGETSGRRSLHASEKDGKILLHCFAGCQTNDILTSLKLKAADLFTDTREKKRGKEIVATYDYIDASGTLIYQVVRYLLPDGGKTFSQRRPDGRGGWIWNMTGVTPLPYRLPELLQALERGRVVFVVEGEKDVDGLAKIGLVATTNHGGAGQWREAHSKYFPSNVNVVILPDNDKSGRDHAQSVASQLTDRGCQVKILDLPGLPEKGDVSDWIAAGGTRDDLIPLIQAARTWQPAQAVDDWPEPDGDIPHETDDEKKLKRKAQADILIELAADAQLFHDEKQDCFGRIEVNGHNETWPLRSRFFKRWLTGRYYAETGKSPNSESISQAISVLEAQATFDGPEHRLELRVAEHGGAFWYDLADPAWRAAKVSPEGWTIENRPPILFRRYKNTVPQVEPRRVKDGIWRLLDFVNLKGSAEEYMLVVYAVTCLVPGIPHPIPVFHGEKGAAKSTTLRVLRRLVDPAAQELQTLPRDLNELALQLAHNYMPAYDNLSVIQGWQSDMFCCASTGGGISKRELYSNDDETILSFRRCPTLNGINCIATKTDLLDRSVIFELQRIPPESRREESNFWREFEEARPGIVGGMFDALAGAMRIYPDVKLDKLPRMADFCRWGYAIAEALEIGGDIFLKAYLENIGKANESAVQNNPVAAAIMALMAGNTYWRGTAGALLEVLERVAESEKISTRVKFWPQAANALSRRLVQIKSNLADAGIEILEGYNAHAKNKTIELRRITGNTSATSATYANPVTARPAACGDTAEVLRAGKVSPQIPPQEKPSNGAACGDCGDSGDTFGNSPEAGYKKTTSPDGREILFDDSEIPF